MNGKLSTRKANNFSIGIMVPIKKKLYNYPFFQLLPRFLRPTWPPIVVLGLKHYYLPGYAFLLRYTFGWVRAEVLGALVNAVFLVALCFSIFVEALKRIVIPEGISNPRMVLIVGGVGLFVNLIGLFLFHQHRHSHGGHSHSHGGGHGHSDGSSANGEYCEQFCLCSTLITLARVFISGENCGFPLT